MSHVTTEGLHDQAVGLDTRSPTEVATLLASAQVDAARAVSGAGDAIAAGAKAMADAIRNGGSLYYTAAGSSGLMAAADAMELGGTFGIEADRIHIVMAGGLPTSADMPGDTEDAADELPAAFADMSDRDAMIAVTASGSTPFTIKAASMARAKGATVIGIANNAGAPLFDLSQHPVFLATPPEILSGSTRMGAGTAQKIALNMMSTLMAMDLGHVHDGMMVNLRADNQKLRERARRMVCLIADVSDDQAARALGEADGAVKTAVLIAAGADAAAAMMELKNSGGHLRPALENVRASARVSQ